MGRTTDGTWYVLSYCATFFLSQKMSDFWFPPELHHNGWPKLAIFYLPKLNALFQFGASKIGQRKASGRENGICP
jgi:hypothetical protein